MESAIVLNISRVSWLESFQDAGQPGIVGMPIDAPFLATLRDRVLELDVKPTRGGVAKLGWEKPKKSSGGHVSF